MLKKLRALAYETAQNMKEPIEIEESVKWGQASFASHAPAISSPFRLAPIKNNENKVGLYFICTTTLVQDFRERYSDVFTFEGNRALLFDVDKPLPEDEIKHCMAMALTYKKN